MRQLLIIIWIFLSWACSVDRKNPIADTAVHAPLQEQEESKSDTTTVDRQAELTNPLSRFIDSEIKITDASGDDVIIQNSLPKGGGYIDNTGGPGYTDATGTNYSYVIFWSRIINATASPVDLAIRFPVVVPAPHSYVRLLLPPGTMSIDKVSAYNYGITDLRSFLDTNFYKPEHLEQTINPGEEYLFYVAMLSAKTGGTARTGIEVEGENLYYKFALNNESGRIPCGQIVLNK